MKREKICVNCQKLINLDKEKYVLLGTYNGKSVLDESYYHFKCFQDWYNSKVKEKAENVLKGATKKITGMLGGLMGNSGGNVKEVFDVNAEIPNMEAEVNIFKNGK